MQKKDTTILYSASDIVSFLDCEHKTTLDLIDLETPLPKAEDDEETMLYQKKGFEHEGSYVAHLKSKVTVFADISPAKDDIDEAAIKTIEAMRSGADIIYQATFIKHPFLGHADFLKKVAHPSSLGGYSYEVIDTKLARSTKAKFIIQLCFYSELLAHLQGHDPLMMHIVLGDGREESFRCADYSKYYAMLKERFIKRMQSGHIDTYPEKHEHCDICRWRNICEEQWIKDDHLNQVANISRIQIKKLKAGGISTLKALAGTDNTTIPKMVSETLSKLRRQASLQLKKRQTGQNCHELLPVDPARKRGFARLPEPDEGDIFFDMESDSMDIDGLEYLFGVYYFDKRRPHFMPIWAHNRNEEKKAFIRFMDFAARRLNRYPKAHIYHYGQYEEAALKKLMSLHGTHEAEVDNLLRFGKLVDLYKVVREGMMISEPAYSLKNVEHFYLAERTGEVKNAGASVVYYDRWKETGDKTFLQNIEDYNRDDVISTYELRQWLLQIRPKGVQWADHTETADNRTSDISMRNDKEIRLAEYQKMLTAGLEADAMLAHEGNPILKKRVIGKEDVDIAAMIKKLGNSDWVREGRGFYDVNDGVCPFCQQATAEAFAQSLNEYFDEAFEADSKAIDDLVTNYRTDSSRLQQQLSSIIIDPSKFIDIEKLRMEKDLLDSTVTVNIQKLTAKKKEPSQVAELQSLGNVLSTIKGLIDASNSLVVKHNTMVANLSRERRDLTAQVWKYLLEVELKVDLDSYKTKRDALNKAVDGVTEQIALATKEKNKTAAGIRELEKLTTSIQPTIDGINALLSSFGFQSFLIAKADNGKCYKLVRADGADAKATLSEGEKNFVTFLYFYHLLKGSDSDSGMTTDRVVVIDDPVSSLDSDILFIVSSLIKGLFEEVRDGKGHIKQVFVLTHNVYFHKEVTFNPKRRGKTMTEETFWVVRKSGLVSKIEKHDCNPIRTSYDLLWGEVRKPDHSNLTIQNTLRRILENYFKILGGVDPDAICTLFDGKEKLICKSLFSWVNEGSHYAHDDLYISVDDAVVDAYLQVFKAIFEKSGHLAHYEMMMAST